MAKPHKVDEWGIGPRVSEMWALGRKGRSIVKDVRGDVEAWAARTKEPMPNDNAITMAITRYMKSGPIDRRTKRCKEQERVEEIKVEAVKEIVAVQVDVAQTLNRYVQRIDAEVIRLESVMERDQLTGKLVAPDFGKYYSSMVGLSKEMRGWMVLFVDIKDRLAQHEQFENAVKAILAALAADCPPAILEKIIDRLKADPAVKALM